MITGRGVGLFLLVVVSVFWFGCGGGGNSNVTIQVTSLVASQSRGVHLFRDAAPIAKGLMPGNGWLDDAPTFPSATTFWGGWIQSAAPEYLKVTLTKVEVEGDWGGMETLWEGSRELTLTGAAVDISDINNEANRLPAGHATKIRATFRSEAKIKGSVTGLFNLTNAGPNAGTTKTFYTKAAGAYSPVTHSGGLSSYSDYESSPAEEVSVWVSGDNDTFFVENVCDATISEASSATLTILFDLNRVLRFYDGANTLGTSGVNPGDPANKAYFFTHSLLSTFIGVFFGAPGTIEGYQSYYSASSKDNGGVKGWMTLIFDASGNFLSGMLMGDNDNDLTIAKGRVTAFTAGSGSTYDFTYDTSPGSVTGFQRLTTIGQHTGFLNFTTSGSQPHAGQACFDLQFKQ